MNQDPAAPPRKKLPRIFFALVVLGLFAGLVIRVSSPSEPKYQGAALSSWLTRYANEVDSEPQRNEAVAAIRQIGTNALPVAIRWLRASDSKFKLRMNDLLERQSVFHFDFIPADEYHDRATRIFSILGPDAKPAIPELGKLLDDTNTTQRATLILCSLGQDALPGLLRGLTNRNPEVRQLTASILLADELEPPHGDHTGALLVLPNDLLLKLLPDSEPEVGRLAAHALGEAAKRKSIRPELAVPALVNGLADTNLGSWQETVAALGRFGPEAKPAIPALLNCLSSYDHLQTALDCLHSIGAEPSLIISALNRNLNAEDEVTRWWTARVLGDFGAAAKSSVPLLLDAARGQNDRVRTAIYVALQKIDPGVAVANAKTLDVNYLDPSLIPLLIKSLSDKNALERRVAANCLAKYGTNGQAAVPALKTALVDEDAKVRSAAADALKKIDPNASASAASK